MSLKSAIVALEAASEADGWDKPPVVFEVIGEELVLRSMNGHPVEQIEMLRQEGWHPMAVVVVFEGWTVMTREEAEQVPEWDEVSDEVKESWGLVQMAATPSEMGPFRVEVRSVMYADAMNDQYLLTRKRGEEPFWADAMAGEVAAAVLSAVTPFR